MEDVMKLHSLVRASIGIALIMGLGAAAEAAEIKVLASNAVKTVLEELGPQFEKATGNTLAFRFAPAAELKAAIEKGEAFDVAILVTAGIDDLIKQGRLAAATRADIAKSGAGMAMRKGAPKPDIVTADGFKRTLLGAKSIAYVGTGATAANMRAIFAKLGIAEEMKAKTKTLSGISAAEAVAKGEAEFGFTQVSEILHVPGAELVGPLPPEVQIYTVFPAAVGTGTANPAAAQAFIRFLTTPAAGAVIKAKGMEPG
jgi:molybdate transport system substrate-binding protein